MKQQHTVRVAVDAMGGDYAPAEPVQGALEALSEGGVEVLLVGDPDTVKAELQRQRAPDLPVVPSEGVIHEEQSPVQALRRYPKASIAMSTGLVKEGKADASVSMGSTGGAMAAATFALGVLEGIERPALGGPVLGFNPGSVLVDLGTSVDVRPAQLVQYGVMGMVFARSVMQVPSPTIGLLSVGAEAGKGNRQTREAYELFQASGLPFVGNLEGTDLATNRATVIVCDGFIGNVLMKYTESLGEAINTYLRERLTGRVAPEFLDALADEVFERTNMAQTIGGGPLFGVNGVTVVGHGRARASAVAAAIRLARRAVEERFIEGMQAGLANVRSAVGGA